MPGIAGCIRLESGAPLAPDCAAQLTAALVREPDYTCHSIARGPEAVAMALGPRLSWAVAGSAVDASSGIHAGFYGEFYGPEFREIPESAIAATLIEQYKCHGARLPEVLDGSFVVLIWDARAGEALLFNDAVGSRPVYYGEQNGRFYFSPEPKGIARLPGFHAEIDELALVTFLSQANLLGCQTYYKEVRALPPGSAVRIGRLGPRVEPYYRYSIPESIPDRGPEFYIEGLSAALTRAIRKRIHRAGEAVIPISGGYDSRGILAMVAGMSGAKLRTISWGTEESTPEADTCIGREVARHFGTEHLFFRRDPATMPENIEEMVDRVDGMTADPALHYCEVQVMRTIRRELGGQYVFRGDEVFGFGGPAASDVEALGRVSIRELAEYPDLVRLLAPARSREFVRGCREFLRQMGDDCPLEDFTARKDYYYFHQRLFNYLHRATYYKLTVLEVANPWLDRDILDFYRQVPIPYRIDKTLYRRTLETMYPELMRIPIAGRHSLEDWPRVLAGNPSLWRFIRFHLLERRNRIDDLLDRGQLERLVAMAEAGAAPQSARVRSVAWLKEALRSRAPGLYGAVKRQAAGHIHAAAIPAYEMLFRILVLKLWCERHG